MGSNVIKVGVAGVGKMGEFHLQKYLNLSNVKVVGVYDPDQIRIQQLKRKYGIQGFKNLAELLFEADAVSIAAPTGLHYSLARQALCSGVHVLVEKPMTETVEEARDLVQLSKRSDLILQIGFLERFRYLLLSKGISLGKIQFIETHRLSPSLSRESNIDVVTDLMIHDLDLVLAMMGMDPVTVSAIGVPVLTKHVDLANARLEFPTGAVANLNVSRVSPKPYRKFRVFSSNAYVSMNFMSNGVRIYVRNAKQKIEQRIVEEVAVDALHEQCFQFIDCITRKKRPVVSGEDGLRALKFAKMIKKRIKERAALAPSKTSDSLLQMNSHLSEDSVIRP